MSNKILHALLYLPFCAFIFASCATPQERMAKREAKYEANCNELGITHDDPRMLQCVETEELKTAERNKLFWDTVLAISNGSSGDSSSAVMQGSSSDRGGVPVYNASQCIGAIVNGVCNGTMGASSAFPVATCYGQMINGQCTGPMF